MLVARAKVEDDADLLRSFEVVMKGTCVLEDGDFIVNLFVVFLGWCFDMRREMMSSAYRMNGPKEAFFASLSDNKSEEKETIARRISHR
jgi:hypothetical protein